MRKRELVDAIATRADFYKNDVYELLSTMVDVITDTLKDGEKVSINSLLSLEPIYVPDRTVHNPKANEFVTQPAHIRIKVRVSGKLLRIVNGDEDNDEDDDDWRDEDNEE